MLEIFTKFANCKKWTSIFIFCVVSKMGDRRHQIPGRNSRVAMIGAPTDGDVGHRRPNTEERTMPISGQGYQGHANVAPTHFAATADQWANEGEALTTITSAVSHDYEDFSAGANFVYSNENAGKRAGNRKLHMRKNGTQISRVSRRSF